MHNLIKACIYKLHWFDIYHIEYRNLSAMYDLHAASTLTSPGGLFCNQYVFDNVLYVLDPFILCNGRRCIR